MLVKSSSRVGTASNSRFWCHATFEMAAKNVSQQLLPWPGP